MQTQQNKEQEIKSMKPNQVKRLNLLADNELYEMAMEFSQENELYLTKSKMHKLKGLVYTLSGVQACDGPERIGIIVNYLRNQTQKRTIKEKEKAFYENLVNMINAEDKLRKFFHIEEFSDCLVRDTDGRKDKKQKKEIQNLYMYYFVREFLNHVIAEKMKGMQNAE